MNPHIAQAVKQGGCEVCRLGLERVVESRTDEDFELWEQEIEE